MPRKRLDAQCGATLIHFAVALVPLLAIGAFAIDLSHLIATQTALQKAADAGALEGARVLYCDDRRLNYRGCSVDGVTVNDALTEARNVASLNDENPRINFSVTVERGHWRFLTNSPTPSGSIARGGRFYANYRSSPAILTKSLSGKIVFKSFNEINDDVSLDNADINAVKVTVSKTQARGNPIENVFGKVLNIGPWDGEATAIAYLGFAGTLLPGEVDWPIALCSDYAESCSVGRFISDNEDTGGWTNLEQPGGDTPTCSGAASASDVKKLVKSCGKGINTDNLVLGWDVQTSNGQDQTVFKDTFDCWSASSVEDIDNDGSLDALDTDGDGLPDRSWKWVLPVIDCTTKPSGSCNMLIGGVEVEVLWIVNQANKIDEDAPKSMSSSTTSWSNTSTDGTVRWTDFVSAFNLQEPDGTPAAWRQKTIYFIPVCNTRSSLSLGGTGGANFGIHASIPVLVQ